MSLIQRKDELTSLERVSLTLARKDVDRVAAVPLVCGASYRVLGTRYDKWSNDAEVATKSLLAAQELIGQDAFLLLVDLSVEAADFGQELLFPKYSTAYPDFNNQLINATDEYNKVKKINPRETKRMKQVIDIIKGLSKAKGNEVAILGFIYGPLGVLSQMRGHKNLFTDLIRHPQEVLAAVDIITDVLVEYAKAQVEAGAHSVCIDPLYSSSTVLSKKTWEKFEGPYLKRIADAIREAGAAVSIHNCGDGVYFEEVIKWSNPIAISVAHPAHGSKTWEEHAKTWGKKVITIGYSDPATTGLNMSTDEVLEDCKSQIDLFRKNDAGFILSTGCEFPPNGNLLSAAAMVEASRRYGR
ncbi:uroporphyrinogen decarboxylase family protein [Clostridium estertheticum]|uniref:Uroporphyrinogen decarboxylase family protein n=1 Tax=Clostridium estertheticum TaxID=238834 RepID=A0AA47I8L6_9CLOT|nr:uroporphyrinogen decarboxylase family protein [Clostridium estertheticum]MBU3154563.1 uroporphyrinogen decarboxylase family protein [Clostridium estertheticum]MBU3177707.1 uroporphyrinogen decarboxylase family protein [Clostridium estertheticum]WAG62005.1 uroporphyrinogen decarboxylase family protein [Clostridium estertheticum]